MMPPCLVCGSQTAARATFSEVCEDASACDARHAALREPTPSPTIVEEHFRRIDKIRSTSGMLREVEVLGSPCREAVLRFGLQHSRFQWWWSSFAERFSLPKPWPERARCPFVFPINGEGPHGGEQCEEMSGHEEFALNMGHLPPPSPPPKPPPSPPRRYAPSPFHVAVVAMALLGSSEPLAPRDERPLRLPPLDPPPPPPPPPELLPSEVVKIRASSMYGRFTGKDAMPRTFVRESRGTYEVPMTPNLLEAFKRSQQSAQDDKALREAAEKRERKRKKRLGK